MIEAANQNIPEKQLHYGGFNARLLAQVIDSVLLFIFFIPFSFLIPSSSEVPVEITDAYQKHLNGEMSQPEFMQIFLPYFANVILPQMLTLFFIQLVIVGIIYVIFWKKKGSTPGKALLGLRIVDANSFQNPSTFQSFIRFIGYIVCMLTLMFGFTMIMFNKRRRGLHDIMANTIVIYDKEYDQEWENKKFRYQSYAFVVILLIMAILIWLR